MTFSGLTPRRRTPEQPASHGRRQIQLLPQMTCRASKWPCGTQRLDAVREAAGQLQSVTLHAGGPVRIESSIQRDFGHNVCVVSVRLETGCMSQEY